MPCVARLPRQRQRQGGSGAQMTGAGRAITCATPRRLIIVWSELCAREPHVHMRWSRFNEHTVVLEDGVLVSAKT